MQRSTLLHLRIPFSFYLLPVFLFTLSLSPSVTWQTGLFVFFALHLFLYPACNAYNSFFDKDEDSIGGLESPPTVTKQLYWAALIFDGIALLLGLLINVEFVILMFIYGIVSKGYSHPSVRLKKMAIIGWLTAGIFQGYFTFIMCYVGLNDLWDISLLDWRIQIPAILSSCLLLGSYPMTQIYQHDEDGRRGDETISRKLGILGTFHFTALFFGVSTIGFWLFFLEFSDIKTALIFQVFLVPILIYFSWWYFKVRKDQSEADFKKTMRLNFISSLMLNLFFLVSTVLNNLN